MAAEDDARELLSAQEVAAYLEVQPTTIYQWCREGRLPALKIGKSWRIRRAALDEFLRRGEQRSTLLSHLRSFLQVPDQVIAICESLDLIHQVDAAFFQVAEAHGGRLVKFTGGEPELSIAELRAELERRQVDVARLESEGRFHFVPETDPLAGRAAALREALAHESARGETIWASFNWTQDLGLDAALYQQEALRSIVEAGQLVVKTAVLERVVDEWPPTARRRGREAHRGMIELSPRGLTLSRQLPLRG